MKILQLIFILFTHFVFYCCADESGEEDDNSVNQKGQESDEKQEIDVNVPVIPLKIRVDASQFEKFPNFFKKFNSAENGLFLITLEKLGPSGQWETFEQKLFTNEKGNVEFYLHDEWVQEMLPKQVQTDINELVKIPRKLERNNAFRLKIEANPKRNVKKFNFNFIYPNHTVVIVFKKAGKAIHRKMHLEGPPNMEILGQLWKRQ